MIKMAKHTSMDPDKTHISKSAVVFSCGGIKKDDKTA